MSENYKNDAMLNQKKKDEDFLVQTMNIHKSHGDLKNLARHEKEVSTPKVTEAKPKK